MNASFQTFRRELAAQGFFTRTPGRILAQLALFVLATVVGVGLLLATDHPVLQALAMWLVTLAGMGISTNAHTASHNAVSNRPWVNKALVYFGYPFFLQVSASYWRHKHLVIHHPHPNVAGVDTDADLAPFFALTEDDAAEATGWRAMLYKYQVIYLPIALIGNAFNVVRSGWAFLIGELLDATARRPEHWIDLGMLLLHLLVWVALPMLFVPALDVITFNLLRFALMSYGMYALFAPAHFPAEAAMVRTHHADDFVAQQTLTTVNYRTGWLGRLICGGVEFQIEHHLVPSISPVHYPRLSEMVREYCERHGYPYRSYGWHEALWKSIVAFIEPKPVYANLNDARQVLQRGEATCVQICEQSA